MQSFIESCLLGGAREVEKAMGRGLAITVKGRRDRATSADFASEKFIVARIRGEFPDSSVLSEESYAQADLLADSLFILDPIDGTHNFIQGIPIYGVSVAHYSGGKPTAGGIYLIPQKELYYAEKGRPATRNGKGIAVSGTARLEDFFLLCDSRLHLAVDEGKMEGVLALERMSQHTRFLGAAVYELGYVACGMADAAIEIKLKPYDFAAAAFIVERAGGKLTGLEGERLELGTSRFLASNGKQHERILRILDEGKE
jgi:myo-inositol-1(or 4)-monophosphatase